MSVRRWSITTFLLSLIASLLVITAPVPAATAAPVEITEGSVTWGIKQSWRNYVGDGQFLSEGVERNEDGTFRFPVRGGSFDPDTHALTLELGGTVRFAAYCDDYQAYTDCMLDSTFSELSLTIAPDRQELRGTYAGRPREDTSAPIETNVDVPLVFIDASGTEPDTEGGTTRWAGLPSVASDQLILYGAGTPMDPVSIEYQGPGGAPDLGEHWDTPGTPALADGPLWSPGDEVEQRSLLTGRDVVHVIDKETVNSAEMTIRALDPQTMTELAEITVPLANRRYAAVDPQTNRLFVGAYDSASDVRRATVVRFDYVDGAYAMTQLTEFATRGLDAVTWNHVTEELAVVTHDAGTAPDRFTVHRFADGAGAPQAQTIELAEGLVTASIFRAADRALPPASQQMAVLRDGSYLVVGGFRADGTPLPARRLTIDDVPQMTETEGTVPQRQPYGEDFGLYYNFSQAQTTSDGSVLLFDSGWSSVVAYADLAEGEPRLVTDDLALSGEGITDLAASDGERGLDYAFSTNTQSIEVFRDRRLIKSLPIEGFVSPFSAKYVAGMAPDGALLVQVADPETGKRALRRLDVTAISPEVTAHPADRSVTLKDGATSASLAFSASGTGELQWQIRPSGASTFSDIEGETTPLLGLTATLNSDGTQVRAVFSNAAGRIATDPATISVASAPVIEAQPVAPDVYIGQSFELSVLTVGKPTPTVTWQRKAGNGWTEVAQGDRHLATDAGRELNGTTYRAVVSNEHGTVHSDEVTATVRERPAVPETRTFTGVALEWAGSSEWQHRPPNGSVANYFSAGVSDGTQRTYAAARDGVEVVQRSADGKRTRASWGARGAHVDAGGQAAQLLRWTEGTAKVEKDGSAVITWPGSASVNFYDGLVPFTMSDVTAQIGADGKGRVTADLAGYAGDISNPNKPKEPVAPRQDVVVATFSGAVVDTDRGFVIDPDFDRVGIDARGGTSQVRTGTGWGAWPQPFVDFHVATGLAAYFYTTGGSMDAAKRPSALAVGFDGATPTVPTPKPPPGGNRPPESPNTAPPVSPVPVTQVNSAREGALLWGVKSSFRSYITGPIAKGSIAVSGGAAEEGGQFRFGQRSNETNGGVGTAGFGGAVRFTGHHGILDLTFSDPVVRIDSPQKGALLVRVGGGGPTEIATLDLAAGARSESEGAFAYTGVPATLTGAGAGVFSYGSSQFYAPGTAMDPVSFVVGSNASGGAGGGGSTTVAAAESKDAWTPPDEPPARSGLTVEGDFPDGIPAGTEITVWGDDFAANEEEIKVVLYSDPVVLDEELTADETGRASWTGIIPLTTEPGEHVLTFQGEDNDLGAELTVIEAEELDGCRIEDASLDWGFKESFRAYISGSIAHGDWSTAGGAGYETPAFTWREGTGTADLDAGTGQVDFAGSVTFSGHDGLLDTTIANPRIRFIDEDRAQLLLDVSGVTMEDAMAGNTDAVTEATAVPFVDLDLAGGEIERDGTTLIARGVPTAITSEGYVTFPNYEAGTAFDPVDFEVTVADCVEEDVAALAPVDTAGIDGGLPWWGWVAIALGILLALLTGAAGSWFVLRRSVPAQT
ncbi:HtaA domain-containing protein [Aeromicrobium sp. YIM 150415]|uniref:HtaA domain-containing protein n=1 Tax=Aeromicrobium sp. YIM 150415 TaxID=2803912 RepID=UPI001965A876|nr:HtaA domain-containing protein [Aeromicrobium sp. YIM 150415]MBM9462353.1 HtaA domain-containing protein [Aeromicrobium sp. YIM 150415]